MGRIGCGPVASIETVRKRLFHLGTRLFRIAEVGPPPAPATREALSRFGMNPVTGSSWIQARGDAAAALLPEATADELEHIRQQGRKRGSSKFFAIATRWTLDACHAGTRGGLWRLFHGCGPSGELLPISRKAHIQRHGRRAIAVQEGLTYPEPKLLPVALRRRSRH